MRQRSGFLRSLSSTAAAAEEAASPCRAGLCISDHHCPGGGRHGPEDAAGLSAPADRGGRGKQGHGSVGSARARTSSAPAPPGQPRDCAGETAFLDPVVPEQQLVEGASRAPGGFGPGPAGLTLQVRGLEAGGVVPAQLPAPSDPVSCGLCDVSLQGVGDSGLPGPGRKGLQPLERLDC